MHRTAYFVLLFLLEIADASAQTASAPQVNPTRGEPPAPSLRPENLVSFDYSQAEVRRVEQQR